MGSGISAVQWGSNIIISEKRHSGRYKNDDQTIFFSKIFQKVFYKYTQFFSGDGNRIFRD